MTKKYRQPNINEVDVGKGFDQYILETEGIDQEDSDVENFVNFLTTNDINQGRDYRDSHEFFHSECGEFTTIQAENLPEQLSDTSVKQILTINVDIIDLVEHNSVFFIQDGLSPTSSFRGNLVESVVAWPSIAGYEQYQAFANTFGPIKLFLIKQEDVKFGTGFTTLMGSIPIKTLIGIHLYNAVNSRISFLLILDKLESKEIFLNNLTNILVTGGNKKEIPIVKKFGYASPAGSDRSSIFILNRI